MTETKLTWHHPLCEGECFACLIERTVKKEYGEVGLRYLLKQINDAPVQQAEQEPDYFGLTHDHTWLSIDKKQYDKLKPEGRMTCYAAPVRTKDLTDEEIWATYDAYSSNLEFARAVIAKDREKNK